MTKEEITEVNKILDYAKTMNSVAYKVLKEALEQQPATKNDLGVDAVSRKDVHDMLENLHITVEDKWFNWLQKACMRLAEMPPVTTQEPRKGHWISHRDHCRNLGVIPSGLGAYEWCSNCDCGIDVREWHRNHYNFCPNCGADMRGEE